MSLAWQTDVACLNFADWLKTCMGPVWGNFLSKRWILSILNLSKKLCDLGGEKRWLCGLSSECIEALWVVLVNVLEQRRHNLHSVWLQGVGFSSTISPEGIIFKYLTKTSRSQYFGWLFTWKRLYKSDDSKTPQASQHTCRSCSCHHRKYNWTHLQTLHNTHPQSSFMWRHKDCFGENCAQKCLLHGTFTLMVLCILVFASWPNKELMKYRAENAFLPALQLWKDMCFDLLSVTHIALPTVCLQWDSAAKPCIWMKWMTKVRGSGFCACSRLFFGLHCGRWL